MLNNNSSNDNGKWIIPLNFATQRSSYFPLTTADFWLIKKKAVITLPKLKDDEWLIANKKQTGYYRVKYDNKNSQLLIDALKSNLKKIHVLNRAQIVDDFFNLARSGHIQYNIPLSLMYYLTNEKDYIPFYAFFTAISYVDRMLAYTSQYASFTGETIKVLENIYDYLTFDEKATDEHTDKLNRASVLNWMCKLKYEDCLANALEKFSSWRNGNSTAVALNLEFETYCGAMHSGSQNDWDFLFEQYTKEVNLSKRSRMLNALGCTSDKSILEKYFERITKVGSTPTPNQILVTVINGSPTGTLFTFNYIKDNFNDILSTLGQSQLRGALKAIASKFTTESQLLELERLAKMHETSANVFKEAIAITRGNVAWNKVNLQQFEEFYKENLPRM